MRGPLSFPSALTLSLVTHTVGLVTAATWGYRLPLDHVRFRGQRQVIQLSLVAAPGTYESPGSLTPFTAPRAEHLPEELPPEPQPAEQPSLRLQPRGLAEPLPLPESSRQPGPLAALAPVDVPSPLEVPPRVRQLAAVTSEEPAARPLTDDLPPLPPASRHQPPQVAIQQVQASLGHDDQTPPDFSRNAPPHYPTLAIRRRWEGTVVLKIWIDERGQVVDLFLAESSGHAILDDAAAAAVRHWSGLPARRNGKPIATVELLPVQFKL